MAIFSDFPGLCVASLRFNTFATAAIAIAGTWQIYGSQGSSGYTY